MRKEDIALDHRRRVIHTIADAELLHARILDGAARTVAWLRNFDAGAKPMDLLRRLRFEMVGHDPLTGEPLNMIEQLNQTFTILASLRSVERLIDLHPKAGGFRLALGTCSGRDIESVEPGLVAAEVFSATHPNSNNKLRKEIAWPATHPCIGMCSSPRPSGFLAGMSDWKCLAREFRFTRRSHDAGWIGRNKGYGV